MTIHVKDGGVWKEATPSVKTGGLWKNHDGYVKDGGVWKQYYVDAYTYSLSLSATTFYETSNMGTPNSVVFTVSTNAPDGNYISYRVHAANSSAWNTDDYELATGEPDGNLQISSGQVQLTISSTGNDLNESTEYFYITFHEGANNQSQTAVLTSSTVTVINNTCFWAHEGYPEWC